MSYFCSFLNVFIHLTICGQTQTRVLTLSEGLCGRCITVGSLLASKNPSAQCHCFCFVTILIVDASTPKYWGAKQIEVMELCLEPTIQAKKLNLLAEGIVLKISCYMLPSRLDFKERTSYPDAFC